MTRLEKIKALAVEKDNFTGYYFDTPIKNGEIYAYEMLDWLLEYPHMAELALRIHKLDKDI